MLKGLGETQQTRIRNPDKYILNILKYFKIYKILSSYIPDEMQPCPQSYFLKKPSHRMI